MYRFEMGIKEISPRFARRNDSAVGILSRASRDESTPYSLSFRRTCLEKSLKIHYFELMLYKSIQIIVARLRLVIKRNISEIKW